MLTRRTLGRQLACVVLGSTLAAPALRRAAAQPAAAPLAAAPLAAAPLAAAPPRGRYLVKGGAVITVDPALGTLPRADVLVNDGVIERVGPDLDAPGAEVIDAADCIVMPGLVDSHYHMWSALGRNYIGDGGYEYFQAKNATAPHYAPADFYNSVRLGLAELANAGVTTVHNWCNNTRSPEHADAELRAHRDSLLRARFAYGHRDGLPRNELINFADIDRVRREWFGDAPPFEGLVHLGVNLRGPGQSEEAVFFREIGLVRERGLPFATHAGQAGPNRIKAADYERRGFLGPDFLLCHYIVGSPEDFAVLARTNTPLSFSTHSEFRLGADGDPRAALMAMRKAGVTLTLSFDAASLTPPNMFELMRVTWAMSVPWKGTPSEGQAPLGHRETIAMATINGARALGLGEVTGSLTPGKRADLLVVRADALNTAPIGQIETTIVQSATPANVDTVLADGRILKRGGRLVAFDTETIVRDAKASSLRVRQQTGGVLAPPNCPGCGG
ncbi:amidohydrolase family protein [Roseomonas sp. BN140053]|uniref:amidohydrolase family protein n=1 Tax=Roseomonas sp. BN140053 TaxID=3391898 RepID=UPI0039EB0652